MKDFGEIFLGSQSVKRRKTGYGSSGTDSVDVKNIGDYKNSNYSQYTNPHSTWIPGNHKYAFTSRLVTFKEILTIFGLSTPSL